MPSSASLTRDVFAIGEYAGRRLGVVASHLLGPDSLPRALRQLGQRLPFESRLRRRLPVVCAIFGDLTGAVQVMQQRVEHLARRRSPVSPAPAPRAVPRGMPPADAAAALGQVVSCLRAAGITPFLCFGTLLGAVRENAFIAHDVDIDLGVFVEQADVPRLRRLFRRAPDLRLPIASRLDAAGSPVKLRHRSGVSIDLVPFERHPDAFITRVLYQNHVLERRRRPFALRPLRFAGVDCWVPDPPEAFLDENYGNWRLPDTDYHYVLSSRMPFEPENVLVRFFLYRSLVEALERGAHVRARGLARQALARGMRDPALSLVAELSETESACASIPR